MIHGRDHVLEVDNCLIVFRRHAGYGTIAPPAPISDASWLSLRRGWMTEDILAELVAAGHLETVWYPIRQMPFEFMEILRDSSPYPEHVRRITYYVVAALMTKTSLARW